MCYDQSHSLIMGVDIFMGNVFEASIKILEQRLPVMDLRMKSSSLQQLGNDNGKHL